jgi:hypothetical protein
VPALFLAFKVAASGQAGLNGLNPRARYEVNHFDIEGTMVRSGAELMKPGLTIEIKEKPRRRRDPVSIVGLARAPNLEAGASSITPRLCNERSASIWPTRQKVMSARHFGISGSLRRRTSGSTRKQLASRGFRLVAMKEGKRYKTWIADRTARFMEIF